MVAVELQQSSEETSRLQLSLEKANQQAEELRKVLDELRASTAEQTKTAEGSTALDDSAETSYSFFCLCVQGTLNRLRLN